MGLQAWLHWPALVLLGIAVLVLIVALVQAVRCRRHWRQRRRAAAAWRALTMLVALALGLLLGGAGLSLRDYRILSGEVPVARLRATRLGPQYWQVQLIPADGQAQTVALAGDAFRIEADVVKWTPAALVLGHAPALYRLDRLSGRYDDPWQAQHAARTVFALGGRNPLDLWRLKHRFPGWLPGVDAEYGSGTYLPLVDGGHYSVHFMRSGALVARPADARTAARLAAYHHG